MMFAHAQRFLFVGVCVSALMGPVLVQAESIEGALSRAYTSNPDLNAQRAALRALDEGVADHLTVIYADDGVQHVDEFDQGDLVQVTATSGGGTDFTKSFEWIRENAPDASCVIYLTDMCTSGWGEDPGVPVLWAAFLPDSLYEQISKTAPFGETIHVTNSM